MGGGNKPNRLALLDESGNGFVIPWMVCPSTPLPLFPSSNDPVIGANNWADGQAPSGIKPCYTGIAGTFDHEDARFDSPRGWYLSLDGCLRNAGGVIRADIADGSSNTIMLGEQSNFMENTDGSLVEVRSDGNHGFTMGADR